jgi:arsenical pump membrane protein
VRPQGIPESAVALAGAALLVALGVLSGDDATDEASAIGPTLALLAGLLVLGDGCERAGLFHALAARIAGSARGSPVRLLALVFAAAAAVTAVLGLDATVVLLTPAAFAAAAGRGSTPGPRCTRAPTSRTRPRCCCRSRISRTCSPSAPPTCRSRASPR